jgi:hypothetical protein
MGSAAPKEVISPDLLMSDQLSKTSRRHFSTGISLHVYIESPDAGTGISYADRRYQWVKNFIRLYGDNPGMERIVISIFMVSGLLSIRYNHG